MTQSAGQGIADLTSFVGRERELAEVRAAWSECLAGRGGLFLVSGEPGIGKTRFTQEVCHCVRAGGWRTLWGACTEDRAAPAYWPWVPILRALRADNEPEQSAVDPVTRFLQRLAVGKLTPLAAGGAPAEESRFVFFDGVWRALKESAARSPLLIVLDDLHAADVASLSLLGALAPLLHDGRALIVATYR